MIKVLFIDDEPVNIEDAVDEVKGVSNELVVRVDADFSMISECISDFRPDILVIDLVHQSERGKDGEFVGLESLDSIWSTRFMPMIVYSGRTDLLDAEIHKHPLVEVIPKGSQSDLLVAEAVRRLRKVAESLNETRSRIETELSIVLRDVAPTAFSALDGTEQSAPEVIKRACFRRLSAIVDNPMVEYEKCEPWEQYVFPPLSDDLMLGDILKCRDEPSGDPNAYRVVLTPSCDLVTRGNSNVGEALVARCRPWTDRLGSMRLDRRTNRSRLVERLSSVLNRGFQDSIIPIPGLPGKFPDMVVDLRELELVPLCDDDSISFCRVASVASPFRELVSWAYIQVSGRPGLPVRDVQGWAERVANEVRD